MLFRQLPKLKSRSPRGDTIIEVILVMVVLAFVMGGSYIAANRNFQNGIDSSLRTQAVTVAQQQVEVLKVIALSSPDRLEPYKADNKPFCIDSNTTNITALSSSLPACPVTANISTLIKFNTSTGAFTVKALWASQHFANATNQVSLVYKIPDSFLATSGAYAPVTEGGPPPTDNVVVKIKAYRDAAATSPTGAVLPGGSVYIKIITSLATSCQGSGYGSPWGGNQVTNGIIGPIGPINADTTFNLTCYAPGRGSVSGTYTVGVERINNFTATPSTVDYGKTTTLSWDGSYIDSCWSGAYVGSSGTKTSSGLTSTQDITIDCSGDAGTVTKKVSVTVNKPPVPTISASASPANIEYYQYSSVSWTVSGANSCYANGPTLTGWVAAGSGSHSSTVGRLSTGDQNFSITCYNDGGSASASTTVHVNNNPGFCVDINYGGYCQYFGHDVYFTGDESIGNDTVSSILVPPGHYEVLYKDYHYSGTCQVVTSNVSNMGNTNIGNDALSSFIDTTSSRGC